MLFKCKVWNIKNEQNENPYDEWNIPLVIKVLIVMSGVWYNFVVLLVYSVQPVTKSMNRFIKIHNI